MPKLSSNLLFVLHQQWSKRIPQLCLIRSLCKLYFRVGSTYIFVIYLYISNIYCGGIVFSKVFFSEAGIQEWTGLGFFHCINEGLSGWYAFFFVVFHTSFHTPQQIAGKHFFKWLAVDRHSSGIQISSFNVYLRFFSYFLPIGNYWQSKSLLHRERKLWSYAFIKPAETSTVQLFFLELVRFYSTYIHPCGEVFVSSVIIRVK